MYMSSQHTQLAQTNTTTSKDDAVTNEKTTCSWSKCPDRILQAVAAFLNNRSGINRLVRTNRQYHRAVNKLLYKFDLRDDSKPSSAFFWASGLSKVETAKWHWKLVQIPTQNILGVRRSFSANTQTLVSLFDIQHSRPEQVFTNPCDTRILPCSLPDDNQCHGGIYRQTPLVVAVCHDHESVVRALCDDPRVDINLSRAPTTRAPVFYALTQFRWHIVDVLVAHGAVYDAELVFELAWVLRLIQTTTFDETRLDYWYKTSYALLNKCKYWQMVELELNQQKKAFLRSWRQGNALSWGEHATGSIEKGENGGS
ncbi:hypothetical protein NHJ13734_008410 [Beauveria thailandica]